MPRPRLNARTLRSLGATLTLLWLGCAAYVGLEQLAGLFMFRQFDVDPLERLNWLTLYYWLPWFVLAPFVALCSARFPIRPESWSVPVGAHILFLFLLTLAHGLGAGYFYHYFSYARTAEMAAFEPWQHSGHFLFTDDMLLFDIGFYAIFAATLNIRNFQSIVRRQELDAARLNQSLTELRFETLRMQVDPHFLFNALNSIAVLVKTGRVDDAGKTISLLTDFFRQTLEGSGIQWVALNEELDRVRRYLAIAKIRFGERLEIDETLEPSVAGAPVPAMLLQPLVENAVTHGLGGKIGPCELSLLCRRVDDRLRIEIRDNGIGGRFHADPGFREGIGLTNVRERLRQMYGDEHVFDLESAPGRGTRVTIELPLEPETRIGMAG